MSTVVFIRSLLIKQGLSRLWWWLIIRVF